MPFSTTIPRRRSRSVVDRLLASPAYGQRIGRHWLDVARYADYYDAQPQDAHGQLRDHRSVALSRLGGRSLSIATCLSTSSSCIRLPGICCRARTGDEIYPAGLVATTFLSNGVWDRGDADKEKIVSDMVDDQIDTVGKAFLGLTLGCARCHDHKFDPVSQEDYYALAGIFYSSHILKELGAKGGEYTMNRVPLVREVGGGPTARAAPAYRSSVKAKLAVLDSKSPRRPPTIPCGRSSTRARQAAGRIARRATPGDGRSRGRNAGRAVPEDSGRAGAHPRQLHAAGSGGAASPSRLFRRWRRSADQERKRPARAGKLGRVASKTRSPLA